jgi:lipopolysaccharide cholinephosphotransferase
MTKKNVLFKKFSLEALKAQFLEMIDILNERDINYYIIGGALLGIVRNGDLLPWDRDTDLFVKSEDFPELLSIINELKSSGWRCEVKNFSENCDFANSSDPKVIKVSDSWLWSFRGPTRLDATIIYPMGSYICWNHGRRYSRIDNKFFEGNDVIDWNDRRLKVPKFYKEFLTEVYGDWSVTIKNWSCKGELTIYAAEKSVRGPAFIDQHEKQKK